MTAVQLKGKRTPALSLSKHLRRSGPALKVTFRHKMALHSFGFLNTERLRNISIVPMIPYRIKRQFRRQATFEIAPPNEVLMESFDISGKTGRLNVGIGCCIPVVIKMDCSYQLTNQCSNGFLGDC